MNKLNSDLVFYLSNFLDDKDSMSLFSSNTCFYNTLNKNPENIILNNHILIISEVNSTRLSIE